MTLLRGPRPRAAAIVIAVMLTLGACGSSEPAPPTVPTPQGFELPSDVTLTDPGTELALGEPGTVVLEVDDGAASAVTLTVNEITKGTIEDFRFFSLDAASKASTPYYVSATVRNEGPAGLGGLGAPFVAHDDANTIVPPNVINGSFRPCPSTEVPKSFLAGDATEMCLVFLMAKGRTLVSIDALSDDPATAVRWKA
ncbi:MAG: hypothetical protein WB508_02595 [Aeromicrobium sp.]|uniref:hypothetical protein n=1 Tax=Aeromicrobium sp. TaxID=1871063 RepID=UPI003C35D994